MTMPVPHIISNADPDAVAIGEEYRKAGSCLIDSVKYQRECGRLLVQKKGSIGHGQWLPWLRDNEEILGFSSASTASRLMKLSNRALTHDLDENDAIKISRQTWGNERNGMDVHYSSAKDEWETPQELFDRLNAEFHFSLDVCALPESAKCKRFFTPAHDGLAQEWVGICWMNPPYGDVIGQWVQKARLSAEQGATVVCLVPARVDTNWWWDNCLEGEIRFLRGRLKFGGGDTSAPFPSAIVIFGRPAKVIWWERR